MEPPCEKFPHRPGCGSVVAGDYAALHYDAKACVPVSR
jgi:hypothetical protein